MSIRHQVAPKKLPVEKNPTETDFSGILFSVGKSIDGYCCKTIFLVSRCAPNST